jgi:hypothetical protein
LGTERSSKTPAERALVLQGDLCARAENLVLPAEPHDLWRELRGRLWEASDHDVLRTKPKEIADILKLSDSPLGRQPEYVAILGGVKDLKRTGQRPHFRRHDGAWFVFTITVRRRTKQPLELYAYDFELCFPEPGDKVHLPRFVRFDLNDPKHDNMGRGLRCHVHPGHDDLIAPAPVLSPVELLDLFLGDDLTLPARPREA